MKKKTTTSTAQGDSTWQAQPATDEWNTATNWDPAAVPTNTAGFGESSQTGIAFAKGSSATVDTIAFAGEAPSYTFNFDFPVAENTPALTIAGQGVLNNSTSYQFFVVAASAKSYSYPQLKFTNQASAGGAYVFYSAGPTTPDSAGGGVIRFADESTAGSANFKITTGAGTPPKENSTVGAEVSFGDNSSAGTSTFRIYGSTSLTDGDTFGNAVFHNASTAANAEFTNAGGTVPGGDGGNTQFYQTATAANAVFHNYGGTAYGATGNGEKQGANGGDVAFDGTSTGENGTFHNHAATVAGAHGGVTSFNNNYPPVATGGSSAGGGFYSNYGAQGDNLGGGGHTEFTAKWGSPTAANGTFNNYGSDTSNDLGSTAGYTVFSMTTGFSEDGEYYGPDGTRYVPTAGNGMFYNHPAKSETGDAGSTKFAVYKPYSGPHASISNGPTADSGTFHNYGGYVSGASGGYTEFSETSTAGNATLIAYGGSYGGYGGRIVFYDASSGGTARIQLYGNGDSDSSGELDISYHKGGLTIGSLELSGGVVRIQLGEETTGLTVSEELTLKSYVATFAFNGGEPNTNYTILTAPNLSNFTADQFEGNDLNGVKPTFTIEGNNLIVSFNE